MTDTRTLEALRAARAELWATFGDAQRLQPLYDRIDKAEAALAAVPPARHRATCSWWLCGWEWRSENGAGVCRQPRESEIHYIGTVDSHQFVERPCDCGAAGPPAEPVRIHGYDYTVAGDKVTRKDWRDQRIERLREAVEKRLVELEQKHGSPASCGWHEALTYQYDMEVAAAFNELLRLRAALAAETGEKPDAKPLG